MPVWSVHGSVIAFMVAHLKSFKQRCILLSFLSNWGFSKGEDITVWWYATLVNKTRLASDKGKLLCAKYRTNIVVINDPDYAKSKRNPAGLIKIVTHISHKY